MTVVVGLGSRCGDDQAGWRVVERLERRVGLPARAVAISEATELLNAIGGCEHLIVVDACRSGNRAGAITRLRWPDRRIAVRHTRSTHGIGLAEVLRLAERLGELPTDVEICGIELADFSPGKEISPETLRAVATLEAQLYDKLLEASAKAGQA
jgi:hydrogenase maturation protease